MKRGGFDVGGIYGVAEWQSGNSRSFIGRQFPLNCLRSGRSHAFAADQYLSKNGKDVEKQTDRDVWRRGWKKSRTERKFWNLTKKDLLLFSLFFTDRNWGVVLPLLFRLPSLTCEARFRLGTENMWIRSLNHVLLKIGWRCKSGFLTVSSYLARQRLLGLPCPPTTSPDHNHQIQIITRSRWSPDPNLQSNNHWPQLHCLYPLHWITACNWAQKSIKTPWLRKRAAIWILYSLSTFLPPSGWLSVSALTALEHTLQYQQKVGEEKRFRGEKWNSIRNLSCWRGNVKPCWEIWKTKLHDGQTPPAPRSTWNNLLMIKMSSIRVYRRYPHNFEQGH